MEFSTNSETEPLPVWSQEEAIAYECARECITHLMAIYSGMIHAEEAKAERDQARLSGWRAARRKLAEERRDLRATDRNNIARIRTEYGALVRSHQLADGPIARCWEER